MDKKLYHRGDGEVVKFIYDWTFEKNALAVDTLAPCYDIYAYCDPSLPVGWIEGEEVWQIFIDEKWVTCHKSLYDRYTKDKRIWIEPKRGQPHKCQYCGAMTTEEYLEEWWTSKEFPENGFNKTAMLDFAEWYAGQKVFRQPLVSGELQPDFQREAEELSTIDGIQYLLIDGEVYKSQPFDQWDDGDFEADKLTDQIRVLISKNETGYFVANAMDGWGQNIRERYAKSKVILLSAAHIKARQMSAGEVEELRGQVRKLREGVEELIEGINGLPPLPAIAGILKHQCDKAKQLLKETDG